MILANDQYYLQAAYNVSKPTNPFAFRKCNTEGPPTLAGEKKCNCTVGGHLFLTFLMHQRGGVNRLPHLIAIEHLHHLVWGKMTDMFPGHVPTWQRPKHLYNTQRTHLEN